MLKIVSIGMSFCLFFLISCSSKKPDGKTPAESLYKEAQELIQEKRYLLATEKLNEIKTQYPYSFYATHSELLQADVLFLQENYIEAAAAYLLFRDFHPKHEKIIYVVFRIGESYYKQLPSTFDRDLSPGYEAIKYYTEIIEKYSNSEYFEEAKAKLSKTQEMLNQKEKYIADFYLRTKVYDAAIYRYKKIIEEVKDDSLVQDSMVRIVEATYKQKAYEECIKYSQEFESKLSENKKHELDLIVNKCKYYFNK
jgi:outer membrane protein assembly factor BamD